MESVSYQPFTFVLGAFPRRDGPSTDRWSAPRSPTSFRSRRSTSCLSGRRVVPSTARAGASRCRRLQLLTAPSGIRSRPFLRSQGAMRSFASASRATSRCVSAMATPRPALRSDGCRRTGHTSGLDFNHALSLTRRTSRHVRRRHRRDGRPRPKCNRGCAQSATRDLPTRSAARGPPSAATTAASSFVDTLPEPVFADSVTASFARPAHAAALNFAPLPAASFGTVRFSTPAPDLQRLP